MTPSYAEFVKAGQDTLATVTKTNEALVSGFAQLSTYFTTRLTASFQEAMAASKKIAEVKSLSAFVDVQTKLALESYESLTQEGRKVSDLTLSILKEVSEPLTETFKSNLSTTLKTATKFSKAA